MKKRTDFTFDSYFWQLKRIQKRKEPTTLDAPEIGVHEEVRESMDSLNSETPYKDDSPSLVLFNKRTISRLNVYTAR